jgi:carbonic anhydrase
MRESSSKNAKRISMKKTLTSVTAALLLGLTFVACGPDSNSKDPEQVHTDAHFTYTGETGPDNWYKISPEWATCENGLTLKPVTAPVSG